jgi:hypothetical protein
VAFFDLQFTTYISISIGRLKKKVIILGKVVSKTKGKCKKLRSRIKAEDIRISGSVA